MGDPLRIDVLRSFLLGSLICACTQPPEPAAGPAPAPAAGPAAGPAPVAASDAPEPGADAAADRLRDWRYRLDDDACVEEGEALVQRFPKDRRVRAHFIACVAGTGRRIEAEEMAAAMLAERPEDPWAEFARIAVWLVERPAARLDALPASETLVGSLADHPDALHLRARALLAFDRHDDVLALAKAHEEALQGPRIEALLQRSATAPDTLPEALAAARLAQGVTAVGAGFAAADRLARLERFAEALPWIDAAVAASPGSVTLRQKRWQISRKLPDRSDAERRDAVLADIDQLLELRGRAPSALHAAAAAYRELGEDARAETLEARLLAEFADSPASEALLYARIEADFGPDGAVAPERRAEHRARVDAFLARPRLHDRERREDVAHMRFKLLRDDPSTSADDLLAAVEGMVAARHTAVEGPHTEGPLALAGRGVHLERAEVLAREGPAAIEAATGALEAGGLPHDIAELIRRDRLGSVYDALAAVLLASGRVDEAEAALKQSLEVSPGWHQSLARLATIERKRGNLDAAEAHLIAGFAQEVGPGRENHCKTMLTELYRERNGSLKGFDKYVDGLMARAREQRRVAVLARAKPDPQPPQPFALERLDGTRVTSDALRGKIVVIKFWFTTCAPCLSELPAFEALVKAYARDRDVEILSIHRGGDTEEVTAFMRERGHRFPVLLDRGYCDTAGVSVFPTFWVLDRDGRLVFVESGAATDLREEFGWRIESLRRRG